jgi:hypothetical protein
MSRHRTSTILIATIVLAASLANADTPRWECWGPDLPDPCRNALASVTLVPGSKGGEAWAAGPGGTILRGHGAVWTRTDTPAAFELADVAMASSDVGWAVGGEGNLLKWRGDRWTEFTGVVSSGDYQQVHTVALVPGTERPEFWMTSNWMDFGTFYHYNGSFWDDTGQSYYGPAQDMEIIDDQNGWLITYSIGDTVFYHWNGSTWDVVHRSDHRYLGLGFSVPDDGWAVGDDGWTAHWDGASWTEMERQESDAVYTTYLDVAATGPADAWAVGGCGVLHHWDGTSWSDVHHPHGCVDFNSIVMDASGVGWIVGDAGLILRFDGEHWSAISDPPVSRIERIAQTPGRTDDLWAVGNGSTPLHFDGHRWSAVEGSGSYYYSVGLVASDDGWASGSGAFHHWDGHQWTRYQDASSTRDMVFTSPSNGWAAGWGTMYHWDGGHWSTTDAPSDLSYLHIAAAAADDVWAVGYSGDVMAHFDGSDWTTVEVPDVGGFGGICMLADGRGFAAGGDYSGGAALQRVNGSWMALGVPSSAAKLNAVDVKSFDSGLAGWMVGDEGTTVRLSGGLWLAEPTPTGSDLLDVVAVSATEAWAVGRDGVILHWGETLPTLDVGDAIITASAKLSGQAGTDWRTDLTVTNLGAEPATVTIDAWMRDQANPEPVSRAVALAPLASLVAEDVLGSLFSLPDNSAASLVFESDQPFASVSRTFNDTGNGTFGQSISASPAGSVFSEGQVAAVIGLEENARARSNLGIVNVSDHEIEVRAEYFESGGDSLGTSSYTIPAQGSIQRTRVLRDVTSGGIDAAWARLRTDSGSFMAYVSTVDAKTGDPVYRSAEAPSSDALDGVLQGMAKVSGAAGTNWKSSLVLVNTSEAQRSVTFGRLIRGQANPSPREETVTLEPHEIRVIDDVLGDIFGMASGAATLTVHTTGSVLLSGRTFNQTDTGTYGQTVSVQPRTDAAMLGSRAVFVGVVQNAAFRSNLGLTNFLGSTAWVALDLHNSAGRRVGTRQSVKLRPGETVQIDRVVEVFGISTIEGATLVVTPTSGSSVDAFVSTIDSRTGDPVFQVPTIN